MNLTKSKNNIDVVYASTGGYREIIDDINNDNHTNIIDYEEINGDNISRFTRSAIESMPKKECIILLHLTEAFSSVYWNIVFEIVKSGLARLSEEIESIIQNWLDENNEIEIVSTSQSQHLRENTVFVTIFYHMK